MKKKKKPNHQEEIDQLVLEYQQNVESWNHSVEHLPPYSYQEMEQAFWHLWTLNCYHVTLSFDQNMTLLLDWALGFHMERGGK